MTVAGQKHREDYKPTQVRTRSQSAGACPEQPTRKHASLPTLDVLYTSRTLIAVNKPAGILVHGDGTGTPTLTDAVRTLLTLRDTSNDSGPCNENPRNPGNAHRSHDAASSSNTPATAHNIHPAGAHRFEEAQALQRLDRDTSGIVLLSLCKETQPAYDRLIAERQIDKHYLAIVAGKFPEGRAVFTGPIGRDRHDARRMRVSKTGKPAHTEAQLIKTWRKAGKQYSLLKVHILTGRKHQIRVHLSHAGFPIVGDALYGHPDPRGLMLHAARLAFTDPITGEAVTIEAPMPKRFQACGLISRDATA